MKEQLSESLASAVIDLDRTKVRELLALGAEPNQLDEDGTTLLHDAISCELEFYGTESWEATRLEKPSIPRPDAHVLRLLLEAGADPNLHGPGTWSPLQLAKEYDYKTAIELLESFGAK